MFGGVIPENVKAGKLMDRIARSTSVSGKGGVLRGETVDKWPGEKMGKAIGEEVGRRCRTWL